METMAAGLRDVQEHYGKRWDKLQAEHMALEVIEEKLKKKAKDIRTWYNNQSSSLRKREEKLAAAQEKATALDGKLVER